MRASSWASLVRTTPFLLLASAAACHRDATSPERLLVQAPACSLVSSATDTGARAPGVTPLRVLGCAVVGSRYTAEVAVRGGVAYTTTWGHRTAVGNAVLVWDVTGAAPQLVDSLLVPNATTTGDIEISDDGRYLVVATERTPGSIAIYDLGVPRHPALITQFTDADTYDGVHTAKLGRVNGKLYGFLSIDPLSVNGVYDPARLVILDLSDPASPRQVFTKVTGVPYVHDTYPRDGLLFVALWNDGLEIWDIGGGGRGGTPAAPVVLGRVKTVGGEVHNVWWYHDGATGSTRYAFVGQEGPGQVGAASSGDIHVIDLADMSAPKEVAFYSVPAAGTHNFSVDEANGILYAAYYNAGVRALDVRGDLTTCPPAATHYSDGVTRCDMRLMGREVGIGLGSGQPSVYVWGVQYVNGAVYASDMVNGLWKLTPVR